MLLKFCPTLCPFTTSTLNLQFFCVRNTFSILALIVHYPVLPGGLKLKEVDWTVGPATTDCVTDTLHYEQCRFQPSTPRNVFSASSIMYLYECVWHFLGWLIGWGYRDYFGGRFPIFACLYGTFLDDWSVEGAGIISVDVFLYLPLDVPAAPAQSTNDSV